MRFTNISLRPDYREFLAENVLLVFLVIASMACLPLAASMNVRYLALATSMLSFALSAFMVVRYIVLTAVVWIVNDDTVCRIEGVLTRRTDYVELYRVVDYQESQTLFQKIWKVKTVTIVSTDKSDAVMELYGIPEDMNLVATIRERVEQCKKDKRIYEITNH